MQCKIFRKTHIYHEYVNIKDVNWKAGIIWTLPRLFALTTTIIIFLSISKVILSSGRDFQKVDLVNFLLNIWMNSLSIFPWFFILNTDGLQVKFKRMIQPILSCVTEIGQDFFDSCIRLI